MHLLRLSICAALVMLVAAGVPATAQRIAPAGLMTHAHPERAGELPSVTFRLTRESVQAASAPNRERNAVIGALVGAGTGVALGYGLALLGQAMYCEGQAECAEYPRRAISESTRAGFLIGGSIGALIGWIINQLGRPCGLTYAAADGATGVIVRPSQVAFRREHHALRKPAPQLS